MKNISKKLISLILIIGFSMGIMIQCYGSFPLVRTVYNFNGSIGDQSKAGGFIRSIVMIVLTIIPVYGISFLADAIILNSIEFWSGKKMNLSKKEQSELENYFSIQEVGDKLILHSKLHNITFYAFRDKPGQFFILKNHQYIPIKTEIKNNTIYLMDDENHIIHSKELNDKELVYIY
jgi:hypothetical protein